MKPVKKKSKRVKVVKYAVGSVALFVVASLTIPQIMMDIAGKLNKRVTKKANAKRNEDDWGPVIEKKQ